MKSPVAVDVSQSRSHGVYSRASTGIESKLINGSGSGNYYLSWNTSNQVRSNNATYETSTATGDFIHYYDYNAGNATYYRNGSSIWSTGSGSITSWVLIDIMQANTTYHNGYWQEVIIFDNDLSANRTSVESDINTYYSIY